ncbi:hypothetical protein ONS95_007626 [Cadophora gregata]|uniref:uncharacterized protein n=1 Tax=Cadophora gregata TaxID=51156 RepID=UPI0026DB112B|nr:uncharacterized protein ONS95_007626 [Cadophora gregata]KAK0118739.1 hypothetical protein ONS96_011827 [Cadophora gregata f. sp. sojae]KAK0126003.1 hypothetical protein ONS95_007626 [Cadophora gregata]
MWLHGQFAVLVLLQSAIITTFVATILFTTRGQTIARVIGVTVLVALSIGLHSSWLQLITNPHWRAIAAPLTWIQFLSASELILGIRASESDFRTTDRLRLVVLMLWNLRRIGTRWIVKNTPAGPKQSRAGFVWRRATATIVAYLVLDAMVSAPVPDVALFSIQKQTLWDLRTLTCEDYVFRTIATASFWVSVALLLFIINNCGALLSVICLRCSAGDCPPLFGSFADVASIRQFWGAVWHQCLRAVLTGHADLLADSVFRIPRKTALSKYTRLWLAFLISGLIHYISDIAMGVEPSQSGSPVFFALQAFGISVEDGFQALVSRCRWNERERIRKSGRSLIRIWVIGFLVWSTPTWFYPQQRLRIDATSLLPIRVIPTIIQTLAR